MSVGKRVLRAGPRRFARRRRRGFSVFQAVLVVGFAGMAMAATIGVYNMIVEGMNRTATLQLMSQLRANVEAIFANQASYGATDDDLVPVLAVRGAIPDSALVENAAGTADDTIQHKYGGAVTIVVDDANTTRFLITLEGLDDEVCASVADNFAGRTRARSGLVSIDFSGTEEATPVSVADIGANCDEGDDSNDLGFLFG